MPDSYIDSSIDMERAVLTFSWTFLFLWLGMHTTLNHFVSYQNLRFLMCMPFKVLPIFDDKRPLQCKRATSGSQRRTNQRRLDPWMCLERIYDAFYVSNGSSRNDSHLQSFSNRAQDNAKEHKTNGNDEHANNFFHNRLWVDVSIPAGPIKAYQHLCKNEPRHQSRTSSNHDMHCAPNHHIHTFCSPMSAILSGLAAMIWLCVTFGHSSFQCSGCWGTC